MKRIGKDVSPHAETSPPVLPFATSVMRVNGTNVVRVPFGMRRPRRHRPSHREGMPTLVLSLTANLTPTPPPQAA